ncbi:hypothetical protein [Psychroflexus salis]|uniref:Membrane protein n=1 Tax=Psychroflexus salis TaxID=1526574 RepID=A0A917E590_9FLAO|nr:hypothetical protein [Psychroflexus salis]GGE05620.1 membrane protein [Psychroflexus salis]
MIYCRQLLIHYCIIAALGTFLANAQEDANIRLEINTLDKINNKYIEEFSFKTEFKNTKALSDYTYNLVATLKEQGFIFAEVHSLEEIKNNVYQANLKLNKRYKGIKIRKNTDSFIFKKTEFPEKEGHLYMSFTEFKEFAKQALEILNKQGRPFDQFKLTNLKEAENGYITAEIEFKQNKKRTIDKIIIKGYEKFPIAFAKYKLGYREGSVFDLEKIRDKNKNFENLAFASSVKDPEVQFTTDSTKIFLYTQRNNANTFDGFIGFNSTEETSLELNGYINLTLINNLHLGESLAIEYKNDGREQQRFNANLNLAYIFNSPVSLEAGLQIFRKDSTFSNSMQFVGLNYQINPLLSIGTEADFTQSSILLNNSLNSTANGSDFTSVFYGAKINYSKQDNITGNFFNEKKITLTASSGKRSSETNDNQLRIKLNSTYDLLLTKKLVLHTKTQIAWLRSSTYYDNELFRFGGINNIRGFEENSIVASTFGSLSTELRYFLSSSLYANSVFDYGYFENERERIGENLFSFGFGLGIETQAGVLRLIFANGTSKTQDFSFENTQVHLSLSSFF